MDLQSLIQALNAKKVGSNWMAKCPVHSDGTASLSLTEEDRKVLVHCHAGCPQEDVIKKMKEMEFWPSGSNSRPLSAKVETKVKKDRSIKTIPSKQALSCKENLSPEFRAYLNGRGVSDDAIAKFNIGQHEDRVTIPVYDLDEDGQLNILDIRRHKPKHLRAEGEAKTLAWEKGYGSNRLLPLHFQDGQFQGGRLGHVALAEGEIDWLVLESIEISAITNTNGAGNWEDTFSERIAERYESVTIVLDNDKAGKDGALKRAESLLKAGCRVSIVDWGDRPIGHDIADEIQLNGIESMRELIACAKPFSDHEIVWLNTVITKPVEWLWPGRIPLRKVTLLQGDPGVGKSFIAIDIAAKVSTGADFDPDAPKQLPSTVLYISSEDGMEDTIVPRLIDHGAEMKNVAMLSVHVELDNQKSLEWLEQKIVNIKPKLVIVDVIENHIGVSINPNQGNHVRAITRPLSEIAERHSLAMLLLRHMRKDPTGGALYRGSGSMQWTGAARSVLYAGMDPSDENRRGLFRIKGNLGKQPKHIGYRIETVEGTDRGKLVWTGETTLQPTDVGADKEAGGTRIDQAEEFLEEMLGSGEVAQATIEAEAEAAGISKKTLQRAKASIGARSSKKSAGWFWSLPRAEGDQDGHPRPPELATLETESPIVQSDQEPRK